MEKVQRSTASKKLRVGFVLYFVVRIPHLSHPRQAEPGALLQQEWLSRAIRQIITRGNIKMKIISGNIVSVERKIVSVEILNEILILIDHHKPNDHKRSS